MSCYLQSLVARVLAPAPSVRPKLVSPFEPTPESSPARPDGGEPPSSSHSQPETLEPPTRRLREPVHPSEPPAEAKSDARARVSPAAPAGVGAQAAPEAKPDFRPPSEPSVSLPGEHAVPAEPSRPTALRPVSIAHRLATRIARDRVTGSPVSRHPIAAVKAEIEDTAPRQKAPRAAPASGVRPALSVPKGVAPRPVPAVFPARPPEIHVTIGRVEVRAISSATAPKPAVAPAARLSLEEYLRRRNSARA